MKGLSTFVLLALAGPALGQAVYPSTPDWISLNPHYSTGAAFVDLDRDGWLDLVVADGNDIVRGRLNVYYNDGAGNLPTSASWQSSDIAYNGHLDVADVNGDGWMDVAVAHLGTSGSFAPIAKLYLNNNGTLSSLPDWSAHIVGNAFGVAFGDVNNDGRPDLAVGTGWAYTPQRFYHNCVYLNIDGTLETVASWESDDQNHYQGVLWVDADDDGWLDLACIGASVQTQIYRNLGGTLETTATWRTAEGTNQDGIMLAAGDVHGDGIIDLLATDNTQLGGSGRFKLYDGIAGGMFQTAYSWSYYEGYGSAIALADVDADGWLDAATGAWWDRTRIFINTHGGLPAVPTWNSSPTSVIEKIVFADLDPPCGQVLPHRQRFLPDGDRRFFRLPLQQIQALVEVNRDGVLLAPDQYTWNRERGWIMVDAAPAEYLEVAYTYSRTVEMGITNWDNNIGNYLYYHLGVIDCNDNLVPDGCDIFNGTSTDANGNGVPDECEELVLPDSFQVIFGLYRSGSASDLFASDDAYVVIEQRPALSVLLPLIRLEIDGTAADAFASQLSVTVESSATSLPGRPPQRLSMFDHDDAAWEKLDQRETTAADATVEVVVPYPARLIAAGSGDVRLRLEWFDPGNVISPAWVVKIDQAVWSVSP